MAAVSGAIFKWETLEEVAPHDLHYEPPIPGKMYKVELASGETVRVWRGDDLLSYFCHGLTFGGKNAPGGPVSPYSGEEVNTILQNEYVPVQPESSAVAGDILVWHDPDGNTPHSAILDQPVVSPGTAFLDYESKLVTKNGKEPETVMTLEQLIEDYYGESYRVYRRK